MNEAGAFHVHHVMRSTICRRSKYRLRFRMPFIRRTRLKCNVQGAPRKNGDASRRQVFLEPLEP